MGSRPVAPEVNESFLRGAFTGDYSRAGVERSIAYFEDAIKRDATFAPAYVGLQTRTISTAQRVSAALLRMKYVPRSSARFERHWS